MEKKNINFEETMKKLEEITTELEKGDLNLDDSIKKFEEGMELSKQCNNYLEATEKKINILLQKESGVIEEKFAD